MGYKISELSSNATPATGDLIPNVDISDTTQAASGTTKRSTLQQIVDFVISLLTKSSVGLSNVDNTSDATKISNAKATGAVVNTGTSDITIVTPKAIADSAVSTATKTQTLTNKRITPRILSATSYTTDTGTSLNCDNLDRFIVTAQAGNLKFNNPTGTPTDGQTLWLMVTGTAARALTWDTQFEASAAVVLPTTTVTTARLDIGFVFRSDTSKWHCVAAV